MPRFVVNLFLIALLLAVQCLSAAASPAVPFSIAFFYAPKPPLDELKAFDLVVVDPDTVGISPGVYKSPHSQLFAYVSVGEADPNRIWYKQMNPRWLIADNLAWKSKVIDVSNPEWRAFFLDTVVEPLWQAGYRGFFLDTLDSYQLAKERERYPEMEAGLVITIREIKKRHPGARLVLNRGFEVLKQVTDVVFAVAAESLFQTVDPVSGRYGVVAEQDRQWLLNRFAEVQKSGLPVISIDYVDPGNRALARETAAKIKELGFIPWVTDKDIGSLGVGAVEVTPRKILGLYNGDEGPDPIYANLHRLAVMPLNYLGYQVELHDLARPLPAGIVAGRYAGIVVWPNSDHTDAKNVLSNWVKSQIQHGVPVAFLGRFGFSPLLAGQLPSLEYRAARTPPRQLSVLYRNPAILLEKESQPVAAQFVPLKITSGESLLTIGSPDGKQTSDAIAITPWGGYALEPFVTMPAISDQGARWILDPFEFLRQALKLQLQPAPDTTTENGVRLLLTHIDADGFESRAEWAGGGYAATELRERILKKYRIPTSFSVITSVLGDHGLFPDTAPTLQEEARAIFALPWIEAASHSFSHPFYWQNSEVARREYAVQYLPISGYTFSLDDEIPGSIRFIEHNLLPPGKKVSLFQWSGDCTPGGDALAVASKAGIATINGGYTAVTETSRGFALVSPLGVEKDGYFQVFAPNQNENIYTNHWSAPFYGYRRVLETFRLTDAPRRLKPINIYYHLFSMTKTASWKALDEVYTSVLAQKPFPIYASEYVNNVLDFNRTVIARTGDSWLIRNSGDLRELRLPIRAGYPDFAASRGVIGYSDHYDQRYIHLAPGGNAVLQLTDMPPARPWIAAASAKVNSFDWTQDGIRLSVTTQTEGSIRFGNAAGCRLIVNGQPVVLFQEGKERSFSLLTGKHELELVCK
jgi:uncharacterized protein (TIGR01370 family)